MPRCREGGHAARTLAALLSSCLCLGCYTIPYSPTLALSSAPQTVRAEVLFEDFADLSPPEDHDLRALGVSATAEGGLSAPLANTITNEIFDDFQRNQVFSRITKGSDDPDLVLSGKIHRFYATAGIGSLGWVTLPIDPIWLLGFPAGSDEGVVDLEITLADPDGTVLAAYREKSEFGGLYTMYNNREASVGNNLNKAFAEVVARIRSDILADREKLERARP